MRNANATEPKAANEAKAKQSEGKGNDKAKCKSESTFPAVAGAATLNATFNVA